MHLEHAEHRRDMRLRRRLLHLMHAARIRPDQGWVTGRFVVDVVDGAAAGRAHGFTGDDHAAAMLHDLVAGGYAERRDDRTRREQPESLDLTCYRITYQGIALVEQRIARDPLIEDGRVGRAARPADGC